MQSNTTAVKAYTIKEFCRLHAISRSLVYKEIGKGRLETRKAGRRTLILRDDAEKWLRALPSAGHVGLNVDAASSALHAGRPE